MAFYALNTYYNDPHRRQPVPKTPRCIPLNRPHPPPAPDPTNITPVLLVTQPHSTTTIIINHHQRTYLSNRLVIHQPDPVRVEPHTTRVDALGLAVRIGNLVERGTGLDLERQLT